MSDRFNENLPTLIREDEIIAYLVRKVKRGCYSNVFDLMDDFSILIYPQLNQYFFSKNFSLLKDVAKRIRTYIQHYHSLFETEKDIRVLFDNMWRYFFKLQYAKKCAKTIYPGIIFTPDGKIETSEKKIDKNALIHSEKAKSLCPSFIIPERFATESDLIELYEDSSNMYIVEDRILWVFSTLLKSGKWLDAYSFIGCIMYVLKNQINLSTKEKGYLPYKSITRLNKKASNICTLYKREISGSNREEIIDSFVKIWHKRYSIFTVRNMLKIFVPKCNVSEEGVISL